MQKNVGTQRYHAFSSQQTKLQVAKLKASSTMLRYTLLQQTWNIKSFESENIFDKFHSVHQCCHHCGLQQVQTVLSSASGLRTSLIYSPWPIHFLARPIKATWSLGLARTVLPTSPFSKSRIPTWPLAYETIWYHTKPVRRPSSQ